MTQTKIEGALAVRAIGIGDYVFYGAGVLNCCVLVLISLALTISKLKNKQIIKLIFMFIFISFGGIFLSRTTLVGTGIGSLIIITATPSVAYKNIKYFIIVIGICTLCLTSFLGTQLGKELNGLREYGLELFDNFINGEGFSSKSTNHLKEMYVYPSSIKSWVIGDGKWRFGDIYYMHTDVGYLRLIFFFGLIGLCITIQYFYKIIQLTGKKLNLSVKTFLMPYLALFLILSMKGVTDISLFIFLLYNLAGFSSITNPIMTPKALFNQS
ncbi:MAG: hypothetical protein HDS72_08770 [Bacteroidales bacterium]|nr:hypothetical protein [Bacteroidales bacterium]